jgi:hypothetical protein
MISRIRLKSVISREVAQVVAEPQPCLTDGLMILMK